MFVSGWTWETRKIIIPFPVPFYELLACVKENNDRKRQKQERKKEKNTDGTQTKLNAPHVTHNVKI